MQRFDNAEDYLKWIASTNCNVRTERDQAVTYSGGARDSVTFQRSNHHLSNEHCRTIGGTNIDRTEGGKELASHALYSRLSFEDADRIMGAISEKFAREASGSVIALVNGAEPDRVFREKELPALLANPDVPEINGYDRKDLALEPSKAFERIQQGQVLIEDKRQLQEPQQQVEPGQRVYKPLPGQSKEDHAREMQELIQKRLQQSAPQLQPIPEITRGF